MAFGRLNTPGCWPDPNPGASPCAPLDCAKIETCTQFAECWRVSGNQALREVEAEIPALTPTAVCLNCEQITGVYIAPGGDFFPFGFSFPYDCGVINTIPTPVFDEETPGICFDAQVRWFVQFDEDSGVHAVTLQVIWSDNIAHSWGGDDIDVDKMCSGQLIELPYSGQTAVTPPCRVENTLTPATIRLL